MLRKFTMLVAWGFAGSVHAMAWFPTAPGPTDPTFLIYSDRCNSAAPVAQPTIRPLGSFGAWRLELTVQSRTELCDPVPGTVGTLHAIQIPDQIGGAAVETVEIAEHVAMAPDRPVATLRRPARFAMPASVSGTWTLEGAASQGLSLTLDSERRLAAGFFTYDAQARPAWTTGLVETLAGGSRFSIPMLDVPAGKFAGSPAVTVPPREWGVVDLTYIGCGRLEAAWRPVGSTALASGAGTFRQLTAALACNLEDYAASEGLRVSPVEVVVEFPGS